MRKYLALVVGAAFSVAGIWLAYLLFFVAEKVPLYMLFGAGLLAFLGFYLLWETLREWRSS
jgi:hypothetical protein